MMVLCAQLIKLVQMEQVDLGEGLISGQGLMYHNYNTATDADTAISAAITLPELVDGYHYELDTEEYMSYGSDANDVNGFAISTDGGATFTLIGEPDYSASGWYILTIMI